MEYVASRGDAFTYEGSDVTVA